MPNTPGDARRRLIDALTAQQHQIDILRHQNTALRSAVATIADLAGITGHPHIAALGIHRTADADNPAQPIPGKGSEAPAETTDGARKPDATDSVDAKGETGGANSGVKPASTTDVTAPGEVMAAPAPAATQNVEKMVSGTDNVPSPAQAIVPTKIEAPAPPEPNKTMFADTGWTASQGDPRQVRMFAAIGLARLRKAAGIEDPTTDDLALGQSIFEDEAMTDADIAHETTTLGKVVERRTATQQRTAGRGLVPQRATAVGRTLPSLASTGEEGGPAPITSAEGVSDDEIVFG